MRGGKTIFKMENAVNFNRPGVISFFDKITNSKPSRDIPLDLVLGDIKSGKYQDLILPLRANPDKKTRDKGKKDTLPYFTPSGIFAQRKIDGLKSHSNFLAIDIDNVDPSEIKSLICTDPHVYAAFVSAGGRGLCVIFKINGAKHSESFQAIAEYLYTKYQIVVDQSGKDVSRARFMSYDPDLYLDEDSSKFTAPATKKATRVPDTVFVQSDFDVIVKHITDQGIDITGSYDQWVRICFAIVDKFGEAGRNYFHQVSQFSNMYETKIADRQYDSCLKAGKSGVTIATLYYHAKASGINIMSDRTRLIIDRAVNSKKARILQASAIDALEKFDNIPADESADIINQVYAGDIKSESGSDIEAAKIWIRENKSFQHNIVTDQLESDGQPLTEKQENDLWLELKVVFPKMDFTTIKLICGSSAVPSYHPIQAFFERYKDRQPAGAIKEFCACINSVTGFSGIHFRPDYVEYYFTKWLVGMVAVAYGAVSPLLLVLIGGQNSGKTEFFRRLLPHELSRYYAQKSFSSIKSETFKRDLEISMSQYWLINFDEMGSGSTHQEINAIKSLLSSDIFKTRAAYGRRDKEFKRLAAFGGTTNYKEILSDSTGNRRYIPIELQSIDKARKDRCDRIDLMMEAYHLYKAGYEYQLSAEDIKALNELTEDFQEPSVEHEMVASGFSAESAGTLSYREWSATEIKNYLEKDTKEKLNGNKLAAALKSCGIEQKRTGQKGRFYALYLKPRA
jgi:hypothetical protein